MIRRSWVLALLLPPALLLALASVAVLLFVLSLFPPLVSWVAVLLAAAGLAWFFLVRRRGSVLPGSESSLMGRQSSKEGLL